MVKQNKIYKCEVCGNILESLWDSGVVPVCCNKTMKLLNENTVEASTEKHIPVITVQGDKKVKVTVGSIPHPMEEKHFIEWIELSVEGRIYKKFLKPGDKPEAVFEFEAAPGAIGNDIKARAYCNLHGLWKA